jgi:lysophospholipase L1-like esterase
MGQGAIACNAVGQLMVRVFTKASIDNRRHGVSRRISGAHRHRLATMLVAALVAGLGGAQAASRCKAPYELAHFVAPLNRLAQAFRQQDAIRIVALGSSSTAGTGSTDKAACYPARLEADLRQEFPGKRVEVLNLGVGGQLAADMLRRIDPEVLPLKPALVIWQTGVNDAIVHVGLPEFRDILRRGTAKLIDAGIDVVLLDMQLLPRSEANREYLDYLRVMQEVGKERNVPVLHRFDLMKYWVQSAQYSLDQLLAPDHFHTNDLTYGCLADVLTEAIRGDVRAPMASAVYAP